MTNESDEVTAWLRKHNLDVAVDASTDDSEVKTESATEVTELMAAKMVECTGYIAKVQIQDGETKMEIPYAVLSFDSQFDYHRLRMQYTCARGTVHSVCVIQLIK